MLNLLIASAKKFKKYSVELFVMKFMHSQLLIRIICFAPNLMCRWLIMLVQFTISYKFLFKKSRTSCNKINHLVLIPKLKVIKFNILIDMSIFFNKRFYYFVIKNFFLGKANFLQLIYIYVLIQISLIYVDTNFYIKFFSTAFGN